MIVLFTLDNYKLYINKKLKLVIHKIICTTNNNQNARKEKTIL